MEFSSNLGLAIFDSEAIAIIELLDKCFLSWTSDFDTKSMIFPPLIDVKDLDRFDYFQNFPHLGLFTSSLQEHILKKKNSNKEQIREIPNLHLINSKYALPSAACYHIYLYLQGRVLEKSEYITTVGQCFRNEQYYKGLERLLAFRLREIVCIGSDDDVINFLSLSKQKLLNFANIIGLPITVEKASDPFYDREGDRAKMQKHFTVKEEFTYNGIALASSNFHFRFFAERCNINFINKGLACSGCVGMGIERWLNALLDISKSNPTEARERLLTYLNQ